MGKIKILILFFILNSVIFAKQIQITDVLDRQVTIKKEVKKVIALGTSLSFITYLNAKEMVLGIEAIELKDIKKRTYTYVNRNWAKDLPIVGQGGRAKRPNLEAIKVLNPDIIFTITQDRNEADLLSSQLNIPVIVLGYGLDAINFEHIYKSLEISSKILNKEKRAKELISYIKTIQNQFKEITQKKEAYIGGIAYKGIQGITSTQADFMPFKLAQVSNITLDVKKKGHLFINKEYLLLKNPSNIFIDYAGWQLVKEEFSKNKEYFEKLQAFKENCFITLANTFYYINLDQMLVNSFFIAKQLYPKRYKNLDPVQKANEIFTHFVGEPLYEMIKEDMGGFQKVNLKNNKLEVESI
ncbi:ABC transporter substrate-binding protein [Malaciobacter canalis]|uniref:ABC transporter substrate-binding protein n=1 Tax=Malaciobacter canalis TaxID=1912871 RepID=UPI00384F76E5